jgi:hypothetical protein
MHRPPARRPSKRGSAPARRRANVHSDGGARQSGVLGRCISGDRHKQPPRPENTRKLTRCASRPPQRRADTRERPRSRSRERTPFPPPPPVASTAPSKFQTGSSEGSFGTKLSVRVLQLRGAGGRGGRAKAGVRARGARRGARVDGRGRAVPPLSWGAATHRRSEPEPPIHTYSTCGTDSERVAESAGG